jgi:hypothetical protein
LKPFKALQEMAELEPNKSAYSEGRFHRGDRLPVLAGSQLPRGLPLTPISDTQKLFMKTPEYGVLGRFV